MVRSLVDLLGVLTAEQYEIFIVTVVVFAHRRIPARTTLAACMNTRHLAVQHLCAGFAGAVQGLWTAGLAAPQSCSEEPLDRRTGRRRVFDGTWARDVSAHGNSVNLSLWTVVTATHTAGHGVSKAGSVPLIS